MTTLKANPTQLTHPRIVIIGGGYAGLATALRLARHSKAEIHLVNPTARFIERIRLHEAASGRNLRVIAIPHLLRGTGVIFHEARATHISWRNRQVTLNDGSQLGYDRLVYALGSQTDRSIPGVSEHALTLEGLAGSTTMAQQLAALPAQSEVVVVGSGLTGTELIFELAEQYPQLRWTMVAHDAYARGFTPAARQYFLDGMTRRGITLRTGIDVQAVAREHLVTNVGDVPFALCLWTGSFRGATLGRESGLAVNDKDQVLVDSTLRSLTAPEIYVAGDSAALPASYTPYMVMGCKTAMPQAFHVVKNLVAEMGGTAPEALRFGYSATCVSLGRRDGVVQMLKPDSAPDTKFLRGRWAARTKELVCQFTVFVLQMERHFDFFDWVSPAPKAEKPIVQKQFAPSQGV